MKPDVPVFAFCFLSPFLSIAVIDEDIWRFYWRG